MKFRVVSILIVVGMLLAFPAAHDETAAAGQVKPPTSASATKASSHDEWETLVKEARKEGKLVVYGSAIGDATIPIKNAFRSKYGIETEFLQGRGDEIFRKLLAERGAGLYLTDVAIGGTTPFFSIIAPTNAAVPLEPLLVLNEVKDLTKWRGGKLPFVDDKKEKLLALGAIRSRYICINTTLVKPDEITSYENLLDQKWKEKIAINDPTLSGMGNQWFTYMMTVLYGKKKGAEYMKKLVAQKPVIVRNERLIVEWIAKGKYPITVGTKSTIVTSFIKAGAPIKYISAKEGAPLGSGSVNLYAFDKAPHPNASKLFVNWILSREAQEILTKTSGFPSERLDVAKEGYDPSLLPGPNDRILDEDFRKEAKKMYKVSKEVFKDLIN